MFCTDGPSPPSPQSPRSSSPLNIVSYSDKAFNAVGPRGHKLSVFHEKEVTSFKSSEDFDALSVVRKATEKVVESFKGDFSKLPTLSKQKVKSKVSVQASGPLANYLDAPLLDISRMA